METLEGVAGFGVGFAESLEACDVVGGDLADIGSPPLEVFAVAAFLDHAGIEQVAEARHKN